MTIMSKGIPLIKSQQSPITELDTFMAQSTLSIKKWSMLLALIIYSGFTLVDLARFPAELYTLTIPFRFLFVLLPLAYSAYVHWTKPILSIRSYLPLSMFAYFNAGIFHIVIFAYAKVNGGLDFPELGFILIVLFGCLMTALPIAPTATVSAALLVIMFIVNSMIGNAGIEFAFNMGVYVAVMLMCFTISKNLQRLLADNHNMIQQFYGDSITDRLTGLKNNRYFVKQAIALINKAKVEAKEVSLIIIDIDNFKEMNDSYGHAFGDRCLRNFASVLRGVCRRPHDFPCRFAGDEFMIVMYDASEADIKKVSQDILTDVQVHNIEVSIGAATSTIEKNEQAVIIKDKLFDMADRALYMAKENGRNNFYSAAR